MITVDQAIEIALADAGDGMAVDRTKVLEKPYGWVIFPNTKKNIATGDMMPMAIGDGGVLVRKTDGKKIQFGSAFSLEQNLQIYELGYLDHPSWDIIITKIKDEREAVDLIARLGATYVIPEMEAGVVWKVPKTYTGKQIKQMIGRLPLRLNIGAIYFNYGLIESLKTQKYFIYRLEPNNGYKNGI